MKWRSMVRKLNRLRGAKESNPDGWLRIDFDVPSYRVGEGYDNHAEAVEFEHCVDCDGVSVALLGDNGLLYCHDCAEEYLNCQRCNQLAIEGRSRINGWELCAECFDRDD